MIKFQKGNLFHADTEAIVNTVNLVGVMGKGIALQFKKKFPENFVAYKKAIDIDVIGIGRLFVTQPTHLFFKYIINFPTKKHWRNPSKYEYVEKGMQDLIQIILDRKIRSIAIPPLGAGNGKLDWELVKSIIVKYANELPEVEFCIYEPQSKFDKLDNKKSTNAKLTQSRALLLGVFFAFQQENENLNLLTIQKIAYFFQRLQQPLRLQYDKGWYGPYSHNLMKVLQAMNGTFIHFNSQDNKPGNEVKLEYSKKQEVLEYINTIPEEEKEKYKNLLEFIKGFETPFSLELLATVDWILKEHPTYSAEETYDNIQSWTKRKAQLIDPYHVQIAYQHLDKYKNQLAL